MDEQIMNNEIMEEAKIEVIENNIADDAPSVYVPETSYETATSSGPNKALIAVAIGGLLIAGNCAKKKIKPIVQKHKEKKEAKETARIMRILEQTGLYTPPIEVTANTADTEVQDVDPEELIEEETE